MPCGGLHRGFVMQRHGDEVEVTETEASGGVKHHNVWIVLLISLLLAAGLMSVIWITGASLR
jgi:hypothetical protein